MHPELTILLISVITISFLHTLAGPDHYIPFVALSRARGWSLQRTLFWTLLCGLGHVGSSIVLGLLGAALGWSLSGLQGLQEIRGGIAGWALLVFGICYAAWGMYQLGRNRRHKHFDMDEGGSLYVFEHRHGQAVLPQEKHTVTPWVMFLIFLLGPCEPMIPLLFMPAAKSSWGAMALVVFVYTAITLLTMAGMVLAGYYGLGFLKTEKLEQYMHPLGGLTIFICGLGIIALGW